MIKPPPALANRQEATAREIADLEVELRLVSSRLATVGWSTPAPVRVHVSEEWGILAGIARSPNYDDGSDDVAERVLRNKRDAIAGEIARLRALQRPVGGRW